MCEAQTTTGEVFLGSPELAPPQGIRRSERSRRSLKALAPESREVAGATPGHFLCKEVLPPKVWA